MIRTYCFTGSSHKSQPGCDAVLEAPHSKGGVAVVASVSACVCLKPYTLQGQYLLCYDNGKSAVRIDGGPVVPTSVHSWRVADPKRAYTSLGECETRVVILPNSIEAVCVCMREKDYLAGSRRLRSTLAAGPSFSRTLFVTGTKLDRIVTPGVCVRVSSHVCAHICVYVGAAVDSRDLALAQILECSDPCILHFGMAMALYLRVCTVVVHSQYS
jgi:hypothetical protein